MLKTINFLLGTEIIEEVMLKTLLTITAFTCGSQYWNGFCLDQSKRRELILRADNEVNGICHVTTTSNIDFSATNICKQEEASERKRLTLEETQCTTFRKKKQNAIMMVELAFERHSQGEAKTWD